MAEVRVGISGWRYARWRGLFYPDDLAQRDELVYASHQVGSIELNGSFYSLQRPSAYARWYADTPAGFVFAVKGSRYITHMLRLHEVERPLANFFASGVFELKDKLGPILWQLPPTLGFQPGPVAAFLDLLPRDTGAALRLARRRDARLRGRARLAIDRARPLRHALEVRHPSFLDPRFFDILRAHDAALVVADTAGRYPLVEELTASFVYIRLHGETELYSSGYTEASLDRWARRIRAWSRARDVYCYFDNDAKVYAPADAIRLGQKLGLCR